VLANFGNREGSDQDMQPNAFYILLALLHLIG
jgi:hypothetical protein